MNRLARALTVTATAALLVLPATPAAATDHTPAAASAVWCQHSLTIDRDIPGRGHVTINGRRYKAGQQSGGFRTYAHKPGTTGAACGDTFNTGRFAEAADLAAISTRVWGRNDGLDRIRAPRTWRKGHYGHQARTYAVACELDTGGLITRCTKEPQVVAVQTYDVWIRKSGVQRDWLVRTWVLPDPAFALRAAH